MTTTAPWACRKCGRPDTIEEWGTVVETFALGEIDTDEDGNPDGSPAAPDGYDMAGDIDWGGYAFDRYICRDCGEEDESLARLVVRAHLCDPEDCGYGRCAYEDGAYMTGATIHRAGYGDIDGEIACPCEEHPAA